MDAITARQNVRISASQQGQYGAAVGVQIGYLRAGPGSVLVAERDPPLSPGAIGQAAMTACRTVY